MARVKFKITNGGEKERKREGKKGNNVAKLNMSECRRNMRNMSDDR